MKLDCPHGRLEKHKGSHSTGYSNAIVSPNNALIGGGHCGVGGKGGGRSFPICAPRNKRSGGRGGWEAQVPEGAGPGVGAGLSINNRNGGENNYFGKTV